MARQPREAGCCVCFFLCGVCISYSRGLLGWWLRFVSEGGVGGLDFFWFAGGVFVVGGGVWGRRLLVFVFCVCGRGFCVKGLLGVMWGGGGSGFWGRLYL